MKESKSKACFFCPLIDTSNVQGIRNRVAGSSTTSGILGPSPLNSFKKNREERVRKRDEDSNADNIPEDARKIVQELREIITLHSEQEIYVMLLECKMDSAEAINRLLSQDSFQEVKSKRGKKREAKEKKLIMGERDNETSLNSDNIPAEREVVLVKEVVNCTDQESYKMHVKCNMNPDEAIDRLLSQESFQQDESKRDEKKETKDTSNCQRIGSNQNHEFTNGGDSYVGQCGGNKFNSDETSNVQRICNHLDGSSTTSGILGLSPLNSDLTKRVPISSSESVYSVYVPSSRLISASGCDTSGQKAMADVVKMSLDKAPVKDDCPLPEKREITISLIESPPLNQSRESASVYDYRGSRSNNKNDETYLVQKAKDLSACVTVNLVECLASWAKELQNLRSDQPSGLPSRCLNDDSEDISDFADDLSLRRLKIRDDECHEEEVQRLRRNIANEQMAYQINSKAARNYHSSSNYGQTEPTQDNQKKSSSATDFTFDNSQLFNDVMSPSEPSLQRQNSNTFPNTMHQQVYTREPHPQYSALPLHLPISSLGRRLPLSITEALMASNSEPQMNGEPMAQQAYTREPDPQYSALPLHLPMASINEPQMNGQTMNQQAYAREPDPRNSDSLLNQSIPTSSLCGFRLSASKTEINGQAMNHHYSQPTVPSGHYGSMMNYPYPQPTQNYTYNMSPSAIQQHGGNNNAYHLQPLAALLPQHRNTDLSPISVPFVPSAHSSTNGSTYNSAYGFGMSSDNNAAISRFGSENVFSSLLNNQLPSFQHQIGNSNVWAPQGHNNSESNYYSLFTGHQNQQSPSLRHSQQQEQEQEQRYYESLHQQSNRRDPSNQIQQQPRPSNNY